MGWAIPALMLLAAGCGGGGSSSGSNGGGGGGGTRVNNVQPISVNLGVTQDYADGVFTSVTVCTPGSTSACQTIPDVLVDTGSYGLRLLASEVTVPLNPVEVNSQPVAECAQYASSFNWGPVVSADVTLGGETAAAVPVELLAPAGFAAPPSACTDTGLTENDSQQTLGATGILGIGVFRHDCGAACSPPSTTIPSSAYFTCSNSSCTAALVPLEDQVQNPVWLFPQDNNGVVVTLPNVLAQGALSVTGSLTFGIGTQSDNQLGNATVLLADGQGDVETTFQGTTYDNTIFDTGSNGNFFLNSTLLPSLPDCAKPLDGFYCPSSTQSFSATNAGASSRTASSATAAAQWDVANASNLFSNNPGFAAFNNLGGPLSNPTGFDFGLPFFLGRSIYVGINTTQASSGATTYDGPFYAY